MINKLEIFVVKSKDGKYFRAKGYSGYGQSWVDDIQKAKIYIKIGPARTQVTYWAGHYPEYGIPNIVVLTVSEEKILNEEDRVKKSILNKSKKEIERKLYYANEEMKNIQKRIIHDNQKTLEIAEHKIKTLEDQLKNLK